MGRETNYRVEKLQSNNTGRYKCSKWALIHSEESPQRWTQIIQRGLMLTYFSISMCDPKYQYTGMDGWILALLVIIIILLMLPKRLILLQCCLEMRNSVIGVCPFSMWVLGPKPTGAEPDFQTQLGVLCFCRWRRRGGWRECRSLVFHVCAQAYVLST